MDKIYYNGPTLLEVANLTNSITGDAITTAVMTYTVTDSNDDTVASGNMVNQGSGLYTAIATASGLVLGSQYTVEYDYTVSSATGTPIYDTLVCVLYTGGISC